MNIENILIRKVAHKDLQKIQNVVMKAKQSRFEEEHLSDDIIQEIKNRYNPEHLKTKIKGNYYFVAETENNKKIVGIIGFNKEEGSKTHNKLSMFFIDPEYQKLGIGTLLYTKVKLTAIKLGCKKMVVSSSPYAEPIYAHFGFKKVRIDWKEYENGNKSYTVYMTLDL